MLIKHGSAEVYSSPVVRVDNLGLFFVIAVIKEHLIGVPSHDYEPYRFVKSKKLPCLAIIIGPAHLHLPFFQLVGGGVLRKVGLLHYLPYYVVITIIYLFVFFNG